MLYTYLLFCIPFVKKQNYHNIYNINVNSNDFDLPIVNNVLIETTNLTKLITTNEKMTKLLNNNHGYDTRYNKTENNNEMFEIILNKKKKNILDILESNNTCVNNKLNIINNVYNFERKSIYGSNIFSGGFWKDSDFSPL